MSVATIETSYSRVHAHMPGRVLIRVATTVFSILLLLAVAGTAVGAALGFRLSAVLTGSMRPTYGPCDAIVTRPVPVTSVRPGMIVVFVPPGQSAPFAHRVVQVSGNPDHPMIRTKGDANPAADSWQVQLAGPTVPKVVAVVPGFGRLMVFFQRPGAFLALVGPLFTMAGVSALLVLCRSTATSQQKEKEEQNNA